MKHTLLTLCILTGLWAEDTALFAKVTGVAQNDTLTIRREASYKSKKVGSLPPKAYIAIDHCEDIGNTQWCRISLIPQQFYENFNTGWVNARYLEFSNRGYVNIIGEKNDCYYALGCDDNTCTVVKKFDYDYELDILSNLFVEHISRENLEGTNHFGAMNEEGDGFCTAANIIESHFKRLN